ncbi:hypothetical protein [Comamonas sp. E6]|nr:hypothetical protein [Comamonas sp. E6]
MAFKPNMAQALAPQELSSCIDGQQKTARGKSSGGFWPFGDQA